MPTAPPIFRCRIDLKFIDKLDADNARLQFAMLHTDPTKRFPRTSS